MTMLTECYRVLKPGASCALTAWGKRENSLNFSIVDEAKRNLGIEIIPAAPSNFDLGENIESVIEHMQNLGFKQVKYWY
jgi:ubiquinone/menaquinone biosynthesis C-methylase UbiE